MSEQSLANQSNEKSKLNAPKESVSNRGKLGARNRRRGRRRSRRNRRNSRSHLKRNNLSKNRKQKVRSGKKTNLQPKQQSLAKSPKGKTKSKFFASLTNSSWTITSLRTSSPLPTTGTITTSSGVISSTPENMSLSKNGAYIPKRNLVSTSSSSSSISSLPTITKSRRRRRRLPDRNRLPLPIIAACIDADRAILIEFRQQIQLETRNAKKFSATLCDAIGETYDQIIDLISCAKIAQK